MAQTQEQKPEQLTPEQIEANRLEALEMRKRIILVDMDDFQIAALKVVDAYDKRDELAKSAFASVLRGKVQGMIDRAIKAKYLAEGKGRKAVAEECEKEIQKYIALKRSIE